MNIVCEVCGDIGYKQLLKYCRDCKDSAAHQYCFDKVVFDGSLADWLCFECQQRSGGVTCSGSLEVSSERPCHAHSVSTLQQPVTKTGDSEMDARPWNNGHIKSGTTKYASPNNNSFSEMNCRQKKHRKKKSNVRAMSNRIGDKAIEGLDHNSKRTPKSLREKLKGLLKKANKKALGSKSETYRPTTVHGNSVLEVGGARLASKHTDQDNQANQPATVGCKNMEVKSRKDSKKVIGALEDKYWAAASLRNKSETSEKEKEVVRFQLEYRASDELQQRSMAANVTQQSTLQESAMDKVWPCSPNMCILAKDNIKIQNTPSEHIKNQNRKENQSEPSNLSSKHIGNQNRKGNQSEPSNLFDQAYLSSSSKTYPAEFLPDDSSAEVEISVDFGKDNQRKRRQLILLDNDDDEGEKDENVPLENVNLLSQKCDIPKNNNKVKETVQIVDLSDSNGSNGVPVKKQRRYVDVNDDEDKEANEVEETVPTGDLSDSDASNRGPVKKRRRYKYANYDEDEVAVIDVPNASSAQNDAPVKKQRRYIDANEDEDKEANEVEETVPTGDLSDSDASNRGPVKKRRRYIDANYDEDEEAVIDVTNASSAQNDVAKCALNDGANLEPQTAVAEDPPPRSIIASDLDTADQQYDIYSRPIDEPVWSGAFKINSEVFGKLEAHLSNKACEKVWDLSRMLLQPVVEVIKIPRLQAWPKRWTSAAPTDDCIGLFFFPRSSRPNEESNKLVNEIIESDDALKVTIGVAELLIFPSTLLSEQNQLFQGKYYLWGVFKRRKGKPDKAGVVEEQDGVASATEESKLQEQLALYQQDDIRCESSGQETCIVKHVMHVENEIMVDHNSVAQNAALKIAEGEGITLPDSKFSNVKPNSSEDGSKCSVHPRNAREFHPPEEVNQQEEYFSSPVLNASNVTKSTTECGYGESHFGSRPSTTKLFGLVAARTPRAQQLIEEMASEGALIFSVPEQMETTESCSVGVESGLNPDTDYQHVSEHPQSFDFISTGHNVPDVATATCLELFPVQQEKIGWAPRVQATKEVDLDLSLGVRSRAPSVQL